MPFDFTDNGQQMDLFPGCRIRQRQLSRFFNSFVSVFFRLGLRRFILVLIVIFLILHGLFPPCSDDYKNKKTIPGLLPFVSSFSISAFLLFMFNDQNHRHPLPDNQNHCHHHRSAYNPVP